MQQRAAISVATYRRPDGLARLLDSIVEAEIPAGWDIVVVVVDNDADESAAATVGRYRNTLNMVSVVEPKQGIPFARNTGTATAIGVGASRIIFVDDDERVSPSWLVELFAARERFGTPIVMGKVLTEYESPPPSWVVECGAFQRHLYNDGDELDFAITANVMVDSDIITSRPFAEELRFSGGSDLQLFRELNQAGHRIRYAAQAVTYELMPSSRLSVEWATKRQYRRGLNRSATLRRLGGSPQQYIKRLGASAVAVTRGAAKWAAGTVGRNSARRLKGRLDIAYGVGLAAGLFGVSYDEYRKTHGS